MISLSWCELVIDFFGQLFFVLNEILYSLLVSELVNLVWQMNAQKQKGQALNAASAQKAIDILKVLLDSSFCLCSGHFHLYTRWKGRDQISESVCLIDINASLCSCFCPFWHSLSFSVWCLQPLHFWFEFLKSRSF